MWYILHLPAVKPRVEFLHRTAYEFLKTNQAVSLLAKLVPAHFRSPKFLQDLTLVNLKLVPKEVVSLAPYNETLNAPLGSKVFLPENSQLRLEFERAALHYIRRAHANWCACSSNPAHNSDCMFHETARIVLRSNPVLVMEQSRIRGLFLPQPWVWLSLTGSTPPQLIRC